MVLCLERQSGGSERVEDGGIAELAAAVRGGVANDVQIDATPPVRVIDGSLAAASPAGGGTRLGAEIPLG